jgi:hypothetical protein
LKLAIADPPYPPLVRATGPALNRASRWYGDAPLSRTDSPADVHTGARKWDDPAAHARLLRELLRDYDGFAIATSPDGIAAYGELPSAVRLLAWVRRSAEPGSHRIHSLWEAVILYPPKGRRSNRGGAGMVPSALICDAPSGFRGSKPMEWTHWLLDALSYDPATDTVADIFPGSGAVTAAIAQTRLAV